MKNLNMRKKALTIAVAAVIGISGYHLIDNISSAKQPPKNSLAYSTYHGGNIYIGSSSYLDGLDATEDDILVEDNRYSLNPSFCIRDSYKIQSEAERYQIIDCLIDYENCNPSNWDRENDRDALEAEWNLHNICYGINLASNHTRDVDLDNRDKLVYERVLVKILF